LYAANGDADSAKPNEAEKANEAKNNQMKPNEIK